MNKQVILVLVLLAIGIIIYLNRSKESFQPVTNPSYLIDVLTAAVRTAQTTGKVDQSLMDEIHFYGDNNFSDKARNAQFKKWTSDIVQLFTKKSVQSYELHNLEYQNGISGGSREDIIFANLYIYYLLLNTCPSLVDPKSPLITRIVSPMNSAAATGIFG